MGTNYYTILKKEKGGHTIHLGKKSSGWVFQFQTSIYYDTNKYSINRFLKLNDRPIVDEYGEIIPLEEFWDMVNESKGMMDIDHCSTGIVDRSAYIHNESDDLWFIDLDFS